MERIPLDKIGYEPRYYPRVNGKEDYYTVNLYRDALLGCPDLAFGWTESTPDTGFPPIVVVRATGRTWPYLLLDGLHRLRAYHAADLEEIPAIVERLPETKWFARSAELNATSKKPLGPGDKAFIAEHLEKEGGMSNKEIAKLLMMRVESLERIRAEHTVKLKSTEAKAKLIGRANREIEGKHYGFLKAPFKEFAGTASAESALAVQDPIAGMDTLHILDSAIAVLECGVDDTDEAIAGRLERLRELVK